MGSASRFSRRDCRRKKIIGNRFPAESADHEETPSPIASGIVSDCYSSGKYVRYGITAVEHGGADSSAEDTVVEGRGMRARGL